MTETPAPPTRPAPPKPLETQPPPSPAGDGFDLVAAIMKWVGPAFIVLGMIYGAVFLVETDVFGPPERLVAGIAVTLGFGWLGQQLIRRGQPLLGELVTGTFFAGAFLCSWAVPSVTGWSIGTSILLSGAVGLLALGYSWMRNDSTGYAAGIIGLAGIPLSGPLYADSRFVDTVETIYGKPEMIAPLALFSALAFWLRLAKGWFLPWALSIAALCVSYGYALGEPAGLSLVGQLALVSFIAGSALLGVRRGKVDDRSLVQAALAPVFGVIDACAPVFALVPVWMLVGDLELSRMGERLVMGAWSALMLGFAMTLYRGMPAWGISRAVGRQFGAFVSALMALITVVGDLEWHIFLVVVSAGFLLSIVGGDQVKAESEVDAPVAEGIIDVAQIMLGSFTGAGLLYLVMTGITEALAAEPSTLISAWVSVLLFGAGFAFRKELRAWWGVPYSLALGLLAASFDGGAVTLMATSAAWLVVGFAAVKLGLARDEKMALGIGLTTVGIAVAKFILVDTPAADGNFMRAISFMVAGLVIVLLSADSNNIRRVLRENEGSH